ncbi:MAG: hypothetical protein WD341_05090 [Tistlia sp.]|uniref:hypothetical protein n=1 Tax=Tistlia sp. TaxID=3057121 RepID=UPI0034A487EE
MADRRQIESMIKKKEQEIQALEGQVREAKVYLQALQDVLKRFPRETASDPNAATSLRPGSMVARAKDAIQQAGHPLHVDEILRAEGKELNRPNRTALGGSLSAYVRKGMIFTRTAPNTFGLVDLPEPAERHEPPPDFGTEPPAPDSPDLDDDIPF